MSCPHGGLAACPHAGQLGLFAQRTCDRCDPRRPTGPGTIFRTWAGAKTKAAQHIARALGYPSEIAEVFAGSLAVGLTMGLRIRVIGEAHPVLNAMYSQIAADSAAFWAAFDRWPATVKSPAHYMELRTRWNAERTPAGLPRVASAAFNGRTRFAKAGTFNTPAGDTWPRTWTISPPRRQRITELIAGAEVYNDWRPAVAHAAGLDVPIYADPPYIGTAETYGATWGEQDLAGLVDRLPRGAVISENRGGRAEGIIAARCELVHTWRRTTSIGGGTSCAAEGIWRKR